MVKLSLVYIVYNDTTQEYLNDLLNKIQDYPKDILNQIRFIIIDDCSPIPVKDLDKYNMNLISYRIIDDIPWNMSGARNLGVSRALTEKVVISDMDWYFPPSTLQKLLDMEFEEKTAYLFSRRKFSNGQTMRNNSKSKIAINKSFYLSINGYDERFCGGYGEEGRAFIESVTRNGGKIEVTDLFIEDLEYCKNKDYTSLSRDMTRNREIYNTIRGTNPDTFINFRWEYGEEVYYNPSKDFSKYVLENTTDEQIKNYNKRKQSGFYNNFIVSGENIIIKVPVSLIYKKINNREYPICYRINNHEEDNSKLFTSESPIESFEKYENDHILISDKDEIKILENNHMDGISNTFIKVPKTIGEIWKERCEKCWELENNLKSRIETKNYQNVQDIIINQRIEYFDRIFLNWDLSGSYLRWILDFIDDDDESILDIESKLGYFSFHLSRMDRNIECFNSTRLNCSEYFSILKNIYNLDIKFNNVAYINIYFHDKYDIMLDFYSQIPRMSESVLNQIARQTNKKVIVMWDTDKLESNCEKMRSIGFDTFIKNESCDNKSITIGCFTRSEDKHEKEA